MIYGRKNIFVTFILCVIFVLTLTPAMASTQLDESRSQLAQTDDDVFVIGTDVAYPLTSDLEGDERLVAIGIELMERIASQLNLNVEWVTVPTDDIVVGLEAGNFDAVISTLTITEDLEDVVVFSDPYFTVRHGLFIRYPVMNAIAEEFGLGIARDVDFGVFEAVNALAVAVAAEDEDAIAATQTALAELIRPLGTSVIPENDALQIVEAVSEAEYIASQDAIEEPLIHTNRLGGKRIGVLPNSEGEAFLMAEAPDAEIVPFETLESAFEALEQGDIDGVFAETRPAKAVVNAMENSTAILVSRRTLMVQAEYGIAVRIDSENPDDAEELVELINDAMEQLMIDGTTVSLIETWAEVPSPGSVLRVALESMFGNNFSQLNQVVCEVITYDDEMPSAENIGALDIASFDFSDLQFDTVVQRNGSSADVSVAGRYSVTISDSTDEYDANTMFDADTTIDMIFDGDNWLFCPDLG